MEFKDNLNVNTLNEFVLNHFNSHYGKTSMWAEVKRYQEKYNPVYTGLYDDDQLVATAVLLIKRKWGIRYAYIPWGICMDYNNTKLVQTFSHALVNYAKKHH